MSNLVRHRPPHADPARPPLFVVTGSTSSDGLLAPVLDVLRRRGRLDEVAGAGGMPLRERGVRLFFDTTPTGSMGIYAGFQSLFNFLGSGLAAFRRGESYLRRVRPALMILVDNPGINLRALTVARRLRIPVLYYPPPELWSLWSWEVRAVAAKATVLAPLFQTEAEEYRAQGGRVRWVGHPLVDLIPAQTRARRTEGEPPTIGLFPGSRTLEVRTVLPILRGAAAIIQRAQPRARFVICSANEVVEQQIREDLSSWRVPVELVNRQPYAVLARSDLLLTCSGTATLEAALMGLPMVVVYRLHHWFDRASAIYVRCRGGHPFMSLPNRLLNQAAVPELFNTDATPDRVAAEGLALLRDPARRAAMSNDLVKVRELLGPPGAIERVADLIEEMIEGRGPISDHWCDQTERAETKPGLGYEPLTFPWFLAGRQGQRQRQKKVTARA